MKRIVFCLNNKRKAGSLFALALSMMIKRVRVSICNFSDLKIVNEDTLYITDSTETYAYISDNGGAVVSLAYTESDFDRFKGCRYIIMNPQCIDYNTYLLFYRRLKTLPMTILKTKRLIIRETVEADVGSFYEMYKDSRMTEYTEPLYEDREEEIRYVSNYRKMVYEVGSYGIWTVIRKSDGQIIGKAGLTAREGFDDYELGFAIGCEYQHMGYATEAVKAILKMAGKEGYKHRNALVMKGNVSSQRLLERLGFEIVGETSMSGVKYEIWRD